MPDKSTTRDLFVADLDFDVKEEDLRKLFSVCGKVRSVNLVTDRKSGQFKGCAFVHMNTPAEAKDAVNSLDGARLLSRCISVQLARPKQAVAPVLETAPEKLPRSRRPRGRRK